MIRLLLLIVFVTGSCANTDECKLPKDIIDHIANYSGVASKILEYFISGPFKGQTYKKLAEFVDEYSMRLTGSEELERAIDYMLKMSIEQGLEYVHDEMLPVPYWYRGEESVTLIKPKRKIVPMLGLGSSVGTPENGTTAEAIVVDSFDELNSLPNEKVAGKIVVYAQPYLNYSSTGQYRYNAASEAAKKGAVAALVRSVTPFSMITPHTGMQKYQDNVTKIPVAAITHEDADYFKRLQQRGKRIVLTIKMAPIESIKHSRNFVSQLTGSERPNKVVVVAGHIDSWDNGAGVMDDAGGCFISWLAPVVLKRLNLRPRRTLRTILFTAEEQGVIGAKTYAENHEQETSDLHFVMESDIGTFAPRGLSYEGNKMGECIMTEVLKHFESINASRLVRGHPGPDVSVWTQKGVPGAGLLNANERYFWFHHTAADTINVYNPEEMDLNAGFWTAVAYIVADMKYDFI